MDDDANASSSSYERTMDDEVEMLEMLYDSRRVHVTKRSDGRISSVKVELSEKCKFVRATVEIGLRASAGRGVRIVDTRGLEESDVRVIEREIAAVIESEAAEDEEISLPTIVQTAADALAAHDRARCGICFENASCSGTETLRLSCYHTFHSMCFLRWYGRYFVRKECGTWDDSTEGLRSSLDRTALDLKKTTAKLSSAERHVRACDASLSRARDRLRETKNALSAHEKGPPVVVSFVPRPLTTREVAGLIETLSAEKDDLAKKFESAKQARRSLSAAKSKLVWKSETVTKRLAAVKRAMENAFAYLRNRTADAPFTCVCPICRASVSPSDLSLATKVRTQKEFDQIVYPPCSHDSDCLVEGKDDDVRRASLRMKAHRAALLEKRRKSNVASKDGGTGPPAVGADEGRIAVIAVVLD
eukprot:g750.t1